MSFTWMLIFLGLVFLELVTVALVCVWFILGALAAFIVSLFIDSIYIQLAVFVVVSTIALLFTKKVLKKVDNKKIPTNLDRVIGKIGIVTEEITKLEPGEVKADGKRWSAIANETINVGSKVEILSIDGVKLRVKEIKEED